MNRNATPRVIVFAGPNGAGKTTHAEPILKTIGISTLSTPTSLLAASRAETQNRSHSKLGESCTTLCTQCLELLRSLRTIADEWTLFDNSAGDEAQSIASYDGIQLTIQDNRSWQRIQRLAVPATSQS